MVLGVLVRDGIALCPRSTRLADALLGGADLLRGRRCSPTRLSSFAGLIQWINLLNRPLYSCLNATFAFARLSDEQTVCDLWPSVVGELALNLALFPLWVVDLRSEWLDVVPVTDASPAFGYGMCMADAPPWLVRAGAAEAHGDHHFVLGDLDDRRQAAARSGRRVDFPLPTSAFRRIFSVRAKKAKHSGELEAEAAVLGLRRLARTKSNLGRRGLFLLDARAVECALRKGRSSAPTLRRIVMTAAAVQLAAGLRLRFGYVPSELNPADAPSRGVRPCRRRGRPVGAGRRLRAGLSRETRNGLRLKKALFASGLCSRSSSSGCATRRSSAGDCADAGQPTFDLAAFGVGAAEEC